MIDTTFLIIAAFLLDAAIGDPPRLPHPVRLIGWLIMQLEKVLRAVLARHLRLAGIILATLVVGATWLAGLAGTAIYQITAQFNSGWPTWLATAALIYLAAATIATRELLLRVQEVLRCQELEEARHLVSQLVGRDTAQLDADGVRRAALETLAENASDGIVAPLFYLGLGGLPLALAYKAVNTLDSMVGYQNEKYAQLGWASAKLDDICNYIPARLTALLIMAATWLLDRGDFARTITAFKITRRDGRNHASPNSGVPEAALAGALGIQLGGPTSYFGKIKQKPFIGDPIEPDLGTVTPKALQTIRLTALLALLTAITLAGIHGAVAELYLQ